MFSIIALQAKKYIYREEFVENIEEYYKASDIFTFLSYKEGMPNALLEAMSCGLPCIGANTEGIKEIINHKIEMLS